MKKILTSILLIAHLVMLLPMASVSAATTLYDDKTTIYVENVDYYTGRELDNGTPQKNMALRPTMVWGFKVRALKAGEYKFTLTHFSGTAVTMFINVNGEAAYNGNMPAGKVLETKALGSYDLHETEVCTVYLEEGENVIELSTQGQFHIRSFTLSSVVPLSPGGKRTEGAYKNHYLPCVIEAENFDLGAKGSYSDKEAAPNDYREDSPIPINVNKENVTVQIDKNCWTKYTVNVEYDSVYALQIATESMGKLECFVDDSITAFIELAGVNSILKENATYIYLPKGEHELKMKSANSTVVIDYFKFTAAEQVDTYNKIGEPIVKEEEGEGDEEVAERPVWKTFYVNGAVAEEGDGSRENPFKTVEAAKAYVSTISDGMQGDIVISIAQGRYELNEPLIFTSKDSGKNGFHIVYRGEKGENKPMISGGKKVENWESYNEYIYQADLSDWGFDVYNFYHDSKYGQKARSKYGYKVLGKYNAPGSEHTSDGITVSRSNFPDNLTNIEDIQLVWTQEWSNHRTPLDAIIEDGADYHLVARQPNWSASTDLHSYQPADAGVGPFYIENAFELLDEPGEYYFNKKTKMLYYFPEEGEDIHKIDCYVGKVEQMIRVHGDTPENQTSHITFENLDFRHGDLTEYMKLGLANFQAGNIFDQTNPEFNNGIVKRIDKLLEGQFDLKNANNIDILKCNFINLGSCGITGYSYVKDVKIDGNVFHDVAGEAVAIGATDNKLPVDEYASYVDITNNVIRRAACYYMSSCQISAYYSNNVKILHNDIDDSPYTGIAISWGWGVECAGAYKFEVAYNLVKHCMLIMFDGSHFYCLGPLSGTKIHDNYFYKAGPRNITYKGAIYFDEGTRYIEAYNNVAEDFYALVGDRQGELNSVHDNYTNAPYIGENGNVVVTGENYRVENGEWPQEALDIMANAGLESDYRYVLEEMKIPERPLLKKNVTAFVPKQEQIIWVADYMDGKDVGWHDTTPKNTGGIYRNDDVDIWTSSTYTGRYDVGFDHGDWLKYTFDVPETGYYTLKFWASNSQDPYKAQPYFNFYCDDEKIIDRMHVNPTGVGVATSYGYTDVENIYLEAGIHEFKLEGVDAFFGITCIEFVPDGAGFLSPDYDEGKIVFDETKTFEDIQNHWAKADIEYLANEGIIKGVSDTMFAPDESLTKEQAARLILRCYNMEDMSKSIEENAKRLNLFDGIDNTEGIISREEFAVMIMNARVVRKGQYDTTYRNNVFADQDDISDYALSPVLGAYKLGLMKGDQNKYFRPQSTLTRAEASTVIVRLKALN